MRVSALYTPVVRTLVLILGSGQYLDRYSRKYVLLQGLKPRSKTKGRFSKKSLTFDFELL